jgi:hypothetical protein
MKAYIISSISLLLITVGLASCEKMIEIDPPLNEMTSETVFKSDGTAKATLSGLYTLLSQSTSHSFSITGFTSMGSDELEYMGTSGGYDDVRTNSMLATSSNASGLFNDLYASVYRANSIIEGLQQYTGVTDSVKRQIVGEAKFIRGYLYFYLVNFFGDVPLVIETDVTKTAMLPRTAKAEVYNQIISDLTAARDSLPANYSASSGNRTNANKYAAKALLARVYLYTGNNAAAEANATDVINAAGLYSMIPSANIGTGIFIKNSAEAILQFMPPVNATYGYTVEGQNFVTTTAAGYSLRTTFVNSFVTGDLRRTKWVNQVTFNSIVNYQPYKYRMASQPLATAAGVTEYHTILRLAEQYLIRAEARTKQDNTSGGLADMNVTRQRAGLIASTTTDKAALLLEIENERKFELFCELGHRWFDLQRTNRADAILAPVKANWQSTDILYPIPQTARDANINLSQNDGYQ